MNAKAQALRLEAALFLPPRSTSQSTARRRSFPLKTSPFLRRSSLRLPGIPRRTVVSDFVVEGVRFDGPAVEIGEISEVSDGDFVVETCIVRALPPAVTLEQGIESIREAVEALKLDPPCSSSGFLRFQVAVPPSAKALNWFCSQPELFSVFPLFFISKETDEPSYKSLLLSETRGVFGIGAAVYFERDCDNSSISGDRTQAKRYLSSESTPIVAYGFVDSSFDKELSVLKHQAGSYYFFIPQIELDECEGFSVLSATLVWCDSYLTFEGALHSFESSLVQATSRFCSTAEKCYTRNVLSTLRNLNMVEDRIIPKVYMNALSPGGKYVVDGIKEMMEAPSSRQFCLRLSAGVVLASNMLNHTSGVSYSVEDCANINTLWASLIIEECSRLGLTYFCVAPGSRSSPLTVAASTHPLITCIVCFDERSLAFHAVGYARGSRKPAVVITSSGTAVSNLLPAVVEAHQDFVPLLLLTADRPPELLDAGANQAIDQVKHFGSFVRFFSLPAPTDCIPARMVLTTIDSAVYWATSSSGGPVHVNCPFREPLENSPSKWTPSCLKGLDFWMSSAEPFTKYFDVQAAPACNDNPHEIAEVINVVQKVNKGILLIGEIRTVDEMWAVLLLAKHLSWPVVADILSGLRLRKIMTFPVIRDHILFIDHLDHALLSDFFSDWTHLDVIIQIGSRITSKRVSKMLERCFPCSYIVVDHHPFRYDPSHIVTHRIRSSIVTFANCLLHAEFPHKRNGWSAYLEAVNMMVARELSFQIFAEHSLTEPQVARIISEALPSQTALFIGNSMAIRDADMYGSGWSGCTHNTSSMILNSEQFCRLIWVVGNRGASGIDGLVSTSVGFALGSNKRVLCVIGDVSFLHDTNGLSILSQRMPRRPMTVVVINNHGGAIFSLLPIAERTDESILNKYFYTSHNISIRGLCMAHGVKHLEVQTKAELHDALFTSQSEEMDCVIEVASSIDANANFHSTLRKFACQAADHALRFLLGHHVQDSISDVFSSCKVHSVKYSAFRIPLCAPPTMTTVDCNNTSFYREGFILSLSLEDGNVGFGEVSPLDISIENLIDVEEQLRFLLHEMKGIEINCLLPLLKGSFSSWIQTNLGILPSSLFPSVRCGLEMAILSALAARQGCDLLSLLHVQKGEEAQPEVLSKVRICGLVDSDGTPTEVADIVATLVNEGFATIKLKVARHRSPTQDAEVIQEVRKKVGHHIELRVDANRNWTYQEAIQFGSLVKDCGLQYIEEPVKDAADIIKFCEETGLPVALDETIDQITENPLNILMKYTHHGIVAIVVKPSVVGGFENAALIAQWAQQNEKMVVISSTFESGLSLSAYIHLCCYLEQKNIEMCKLMNKEMPPSVAHGLGTYRWLKEDVALSPLRISCNHDSGFVEASTNDANKLLQSFQINQKIIQREVVGDEFRIYQLPVDLDGICYNIKVQETGQVSHDNVVVFLHGFLGTSEDWTATMKAVSRGARCISIDLPGHGETKIHKLRDKDASLEPSLSIEVVADVVYEVIHRITPKRVTVVGYSMGARIALYMALRFTDKINGAVVISGSPGLKDEVARKLRRATDDSRAKLLVSYGLDLFLDTWYAGKLWNSLRDHPKFNQIVESRLHHHREVPSLAKVLSDSSIGRQLPLWDDLKHCKTPLLIVVGEKDKKFRRIAQDMCYSIDGGMKDGDHPPICTYETVKIPFCGHAVHLENPLPVIAALRRFLSRLEASSSADRREFQTGNL